jgi:hypothetical protein
MGSLADCNLLQGAIIVSKREVVMFYMYLINYEEFSKSPDMGYKGSMLYDDEKPIVSTTGDVVQDFICLMEQIQDGDKLSVSSACFDFIRDGGTLSQPIIDWMYQKISLTEAMRLLGPPNSLH